MRDQHSHDGQDERCWYLVGLRFDPLANSPEFYSAILCNDRDLALVADQKLCFFKDLTQASYLVSNYSPETSEVERALDDVSGVCDVVESLRIVENEIIDCDATIVNTINILLDLFYSLTRVIPEAYKISLYSLADHCTFNRDIASFFNAGNVSRKDVADAIRWCVAEILTRSFFVDM